MRILLFCLLVLSLTFLANLFFGEFNGGVQLSIVINTGSMKSILSRDARQLISDGFTRHSENPMTFRANSSQCVCVTG